MVTQARVFNLKPIEFSMTNEIGLYFGGKLSYLKNIFSYANMASWKKIKDRIIDIPVHENGKIAFDYMEEYIKELETEHIEELDDYLSVTELNNYILTDDEEAVLKTYRQETGIVWNKYNVKERVGTGTRGKR